MQQLLDRACMYIAILVTYLNTTEVADICRIGATKSALTVVRQTWNSLLRSVPTCSVKVSDSATLPVLALRALNVNCIRRENAISWTMEEAIIQRWNAAVFESMELAAEWNFSNIVSLSSTKR